MKYLIQVLAVLWLFAQVGVPALGVQFVDAPLQNGDYGSGLMQDTMSPYHGSSPHNLGIVDSADGVRFTSTDQYNRGNGVIYWQPGSRSTAFRQHGTISVWMNANHDLFAAMTAWAHIFCENYGWNAFHNGQSTFATNASLVQNEAGPEDDALRLGWQVWHNNVWYIPTAGQTIDLEFGRWYNLGYVWGGAEYDYELWINGERKLAYNLPGSMGLPWGLSSSAAVVALGGAHERGLSNSSYSSAVGITYRDLKMWDEAVPQAGTVAVPEPGSLFSLALAATGLCALWSRRR